MYKIVLKHSMVIISYILIMCVVVQCNTFRHSGLQNGGSLTFSLVPLAPVESALSLPAKSTRLILLTCIRWENKSRQLNTALMEGRANEHCICAMLRVCILIPERFTSPSSCIHELEMSHWSVDLIICWFFSVSNNNIKYIPLMIRNNTDGNGAPVFGSTWWDIR